MNANDWAFESIRADSRSQRQLAALGIQPGWRCLEVGAGHGSIVRWLAEQVGPQGRVVATDINPRFLTAMQLPNVEVRQHDIRTDPLEPSLYDLAHCRAVLIHMPDPQLGSGGMVEALRIGGWLLIEERISPRSERSMRPIRWRSPSIDSTESP